MLHAKPNRPEAHERVGLLGKQIGITRHRFIPAEIQRANHHGQRRHAFSEGLVGDELLLFSRNPRRVQIKIFGAKQPDALRKIFLRKRDFFHFFEVRLQADAHTVQRDRRLAVGLKQAVLKRFFLRLNFTVAEQRLLRGIDDHDPIIAIDQDPIACFHALGEIAHPHDRRHLHRTRNDHRVAGLTARVHHDAERRTAVDARRVRRREIIRHDDAFFSELTQTVFRLPKKILQNTLGDIANISGAFPQIFIINLGKRLDVARRDVVKTRFDIPPRLLKFPDRLPDQRLIFEHQQMRVENQRLRLA